MTDSTYLVIGGYHGSGASAVVDLLSEYKGFYHNDTEMRLICDPYGIKPMERALVDDWDWINASGAMIDFLHLAKICGRKGGGKNPFARAGLNYTKNINPRFMEITENYLEKLTECHYYRDFYYHKFKMSYPAYVINRIRFGLEIYSKGKLKTANRSTKNYFSRPDREQFYQATKEYFDELYTDAAEREGADFILLDLALAPRDGKRIHNYFRKAKMIVVDRDPRDILANLLSQGRYIDDWITYEDGFCFSQWQLEMRKNLPSDPDIMYVRFEDIVLKTEMVKKEIADFLGISLDERNHLHLHKYFEPEKSAQNIGYWKRFYGDHGRAFDAISVEMKDYLYEKEKG